MGAKYGKWGTGVENWVQGPKDTWTHKNNKAVRVFIYFKTIYPNEAKAYGIRPGKTQPGIYKIGSILPGLQGGAWAGPILTARTISEARAIARSIRETWNNPWNWPAELGM